MRLRKTLPGKSFQHPRVKRLLWLHWQSAVWCHWSGEYRCWVFIEVLNFISPTLLWWNMKCGINNQNWKKQLYGSCTLCLDPLGLLNWWNILKVVVFGSFDSFLIETVPSPSFIIRFSNFSKCFFIIISSKEVMFLSALVNELVR